MIQQYLNNIDLITLHRRTCCLVQWRLSKVIPDLDIGIVMMMSCFMSILAVGKESGP
jgi:hypothetical protein